jgi:hypothetical protein
MALWLKWFGKGFFWPGAVAGGAFRPFNISILQSFDLAANSRLSQKIGQPKLKSKI